MDYKCTQTQCLILFAILHCIHAVVLPRLVLQTSDGSLSQSNGDAHTNSSHSFDDLSPLNEDSYIDFDPSPSLDINKPKFCSDCDCGVRRTTRIVGGNVTDVFEFPWVISMSRQGQYHCGGSLITRNHVLTAAHCLYSFNKNSMKITLADNNLPDRKQYIISRRIKSVILHENYNPNNFNNDIALIELNKPVPLDGVIRTACLPENAIDYTGAMATVVGWGRTAEDHPTSDELRIVNLPILSQEECNAAGYRKNRITENMFCAGYLDGKKDSCFGDSGGPLHVHGSLDQLQVVGIISWGRGCARPNFPGVYTKLTNYLGWLKNNLEEDCICPPPHQN